MFRYYMEYDETGIRIKDVFESGGGTFALPSDFAYNIASTVTSVTQFDITISEGCNETLEDTAINIDETTAPTGVTYDDTDIIITPEAVGLEDDGFGSQVYTIEIQLNDDSTLTFETCFFYDTDKDLQCKIYDVFYTRCKDIQCEDIECVLMYEALTRIQECDACANACDLLECVENCADEDKCNC